MATKLTTSGPSPGDERRRIFYVLNYGSSIRNIVGGGVIERLHAAGYELVLFGVNERDRQAISAALKTGFVFDELGEVRFDGALRFLQRLRTYVWRSRVNYRELLASHGQHGGFKAALHHVLGVLLRPVPRSVWAWLNAQLARWPDGPRLLEQYRPSAVIISNPLSDDNCIIDFCRARNVPTFCVLESWDNLTNRGAIYSFPDDIIVWNELIADQAVKYHHFSREHVHVTGIPSFDLYAHPEMYPSEDEWRRDNRLPQAGPVVTYSLSSKHIYDAEDMVIRHLVEARRQGRLPADLSILVRFHPRSFDEVVAHYEDLDGVVLQYPDKAFSHRINDETVGGSPMMLAATMRYSAVVVNVFSTVCLEALCNETPAVVVNYDATERPLHRSVRRYLKFEHIQDLLAFDAVSVANGPEAMIDSIRGYLDNPALQADERRRCVEVEAFGLDGRAAERTAETLIRLVRAREARHA